MARILRVKLLTDLIFSSVLLLGSQSGFLLIGCFYLYAIRHHSLSRIDPLFNGEFHIEVRPTPITCTDTYGSIMIRNNSLGNA